MYPQTSQALHQPRAALASALTLLCPYDMIPKNIRGPKMHPFPPLPDKLAHYVGPLHSVEYPPQGMAFQVSILSSARGRFVLKVARTPALVKELANEARVLTALQKYVPFV